VTGVFGCWKRGFTQKYCSNGTTDRAVRKRWAEALIEKRKAEIQLRQKVRVEVAKIMAQATPATDDHPYLKAKGVRACDGLLQWQGKLVLPLSDADGEIHSLQFIDADGSKRFLRYGQVSGCVFPILGPASGPILIAEGVATGLTVAEATGSAVVCAMNCGNMLAVAQAMRAKWPDREIIVAADNDQFTNGNPGLTKATDSAKTIGTSGHSALHGHDCQTNGLQRPTSTGRAQRCETANRSSDTTKGNR
jgi:putative DNA primase/helicase